MLIYYPPYSNHKFGLWINGEDNETRMFRCPGCDKRVLGPPLSWAQYNSYNYCPYCGMDMKNEDTKGLSLFEDDLRFLKDRCDYIL